MSFVLKHGEVWVVQMGVPGTHEIGQSGMLQLISERRPQTLDEKIAALEVEALAHPTPHAFAAELKWLLGRSDRERKQNNARRRATAR